MKTLNSSVNSYMSGPPLPVKTLNSSVNSYMSGPPLPVKTLNSSVNSYMFWATTTRNNVMMATNVWSEKN